MIKFGKNYNHCIGFHNIATILAHADLITLTVTID